jgi:hypothetical protein
LELLKKKGKAPPALSRIGSSTGVIGVRVTVVRTKKEAEILREILVRVGGLAGVIGTTEAPPVSLELLQYQDETCRCHWKLLYNFLISLMQSNSG